MPSRVRGLEASKRMLPDLNSSPTTANTLIQYHVHLGRLIQTAELLYETAIFTSCMHPSLLEAGGVARMC